MQGFYKISNKFCSEQRRNKKSLSNLIEYRQRKNKSMNKIFIWELIEICKIQIKQIQAKNMK